MSASVLQNRECLIYPGEYTPLPGTEVLLKELTNKHRKSVIKPLVNIDEFKDCFKIEVALPGIKREDIFIYAAGHSLSVLVWHKHSEELMKKLQVQEFDTDFLERHIRLPKDADTAFVCAEYREGILNLYIARTLFPQKRTKHRIVVY